jgi:hypothetical protein
VAPATFRLKHGIEMRMPLVHARGADFLNPLIGKLGRRKAAAAGFGTAGLFGIVGHKSPPSSYWSVPSSISASLVASSPHQRSDMRGS